MLDIESKTQLRRLKTQMKAIRLASSYLQEQGAGGNSTWQELSAELQRLKADHQDLLVRLSSVR